MWSDIPCNQPTYTDTFWLGSGMSAGTLIWVTDGSYDRKRAKDLLREGVAPRDWRVSLETHAKIWYQKLKLKLNYE